MSNQCFCDIPAESRACPHCPTHSRVHYLDWLYLKAPRYATAQERDDPFVDRRYWPADAAEIPEFADFRQALSDSARRFFDSEWESRTKYGEWPGVWEDAIVVRDCWPDLVAAQERNALREHVAELCRDEEYPLGYAVDYQEVPATPDVLLAEAFLLSEVVARIQQLEKVLRADAEAMLREGGGESAAG